MCIFTQIQLNTLKKKYLIKVYICNGYYNYAEMNKMHIIKYIQ